ncbi:unnamed protein product [Rotaria sordida]|uniref:Uncharacterized protein n=1 Tax=Rotaria sordida TaxID=392033 RepID=A0A814KIB8_9BILA|nr:unnamed protein product [Rotaria sordida]
MVSNSLNLVNDYFYDSTTHIHYNANRNLLQNNIQAPSSPINIQSIDSPDANSFISLYDEEKWPPQIGSQHYTFPSSPSIPPQLSLIIKNVDFHIDMNDFIGDLKAKFPDIKNVIRLKNKF